MYFITLIRCAYLPHIWRHTFSLYDSSGHPKRGDNVLCDLAGPLCFQGDYLAKEVLSITDMWPTATRWSFQTRVLQTYLPSMTPEPIRWRCIASENIFLLIFVSNFVYKKKINQKETSKINFLPRFNSIRASPIYGYWKGEDQKLKLVCYKRRETVEECLDFWGLAQPDLL